MTNPNRTRAEIQAEIEKLQAELDVAWPQKGDIVYLEATVNQVYDDTDGIVDVRIVGDGDVYPAYAQALIPSADLIPRAEHEQALAEAVADARRPDKCLAALVIHAKRRLPWHGRDVIDGVPYRVTVERVDAKDTTTDNDHIVDVNDMIEPADAEPMGWVGLHDGEIMHQLWNRQSDAREASPDEIAVPLYRHPAPQAIAVAPKGVVDELRAICRKYAIAFMDWNPNDKASREQCQCADKDLNAALARITELTEPSEWAREAVEVYYRLKNLTPDERRDIAAALLESAKEVDDE